MTADLHRPTISPFQARNLIRAARVGSNDRTATLYGRVNCPTPDQKAIARFGSAQMARYFEAKAQARFYAEMIRGQHAIIAARRADGSFYPALLSDLELYRAERKRWRGVMVKMLNEVAA